MAKAPAIISLEEFSEGINIAIYGDSGVGKTVLAGTCPRALFIAVEAGTVSAKRQGSKADLWPIKEWNDIQAAYDWLEANPDAYDWVIIDTATELQRLCMRGILAAQAKANKSRDIDTPAIQDWTPYYNKFQRFVAAFNSLPMNTLWLAHSMHKDNEDGDTIIMPEIAGPSHSPLRESQAFCAAMNVVMYYKKTADGADEDAGTKRALLSETIPPYFGKDRYTILPRWIIVTKQEAAGKETKQLTTMADIQRTIEATLGSAPAPKRPVKKAPATATPVRRRPNR